MDAFDGLVRDALLTTAVLALPILVVATAIGAAVAILQAATQVQEQTLTLLPKLVAIGAMLAVFGRFGIDLCARLVVEAIARIPELVRG
ncbi:flagellar biosynthetic protein FliQ [Vulcanimicrobium alpinum]|uniref:Flagellar biosynthetic protein FliQ n=1 Tax=Vulcanimicrobium alpinum TaxID=3016050 RepID=A0AAN1Y083_UNVUL|nr:flagellar biosynthetic protein FliQ [Vulcanimicrobium alpinum]BDE07567.1 flagellar biosynthetic protein FliQ [Vulcanimicrobium alpinum]